MEEFKKIWAAIDELRKAQNDLSRITTVITKDVEYTRKAVDNINVSVEKIMASIENLNKAREDLDKRPDKEKAKLFDTTIGAIIKSVIPWIIAVLAAIYGLKKG